MKVFVYDKKTSKTIAVFTGVVSVVKIGVLIKIATADDLYEYDTKEVKTRIYQN